MALINLWSGPRNVSTALMYSFRQHPRVEVVDEPLYAHFLARSGREHPGRDAVLASQSQDGNAVVSTLLAQAHASQQHWFAKHMAHHLIDIDIDPLLEAEHVFLVRDPEQMLSSLTIQLPDATLVDTGLSQQSLLLEKLRAQGLDPLVIDSRELLLDPQGVLATVCERLNIGWDERMLSWPTGPKPEDGIWAEHWYHAVHRSSGFAAYQEKPPPDAALATLLAQCQPHYRTLYQHAIRARSAITP